MKNNVFDELADKIKLPDGEFPKLTFGQYFEFEHLQVLLNTAAKERNVDDFLKHINKIIMMQTGKEFDKESNAFDLLLTINIILARYSNAISPNVIFMNPDPSEKSDKKNKPVGWDYPGRFIIIFTDILANAYGWTFDYIYNLPLNLALELIQEILYRQHNDKEWNYRLNELAYKYDEGSKKSIYQPLHKPHWMRDEAYAQPPEKTKIKRDYLPFGQIIDTTGYGKYGENAPEIIEKKE